jgi:hypothetical protein
MAIILLQKQRINILEEDCNRLCTLVATMQLETLYMASNNLGYGIHRIREDKTFIQNRDPMDNKEQIPLHMDE